MNKEELIKNQFPNDEFLQSAVLRIVDKCVSDLEKEKEELTDKVNRIERKCKFNFVDLLNDVDKEIEQEKQLTKAKEIIQDLIHEISVFYIATDRTVISPTVKQAEQFLEEVGKEDEELEKEVVPPEEIELK